ncbi:MAG TPA: IS66 family transposase [Treponemataceae bacterium]|nr:IS66 family transposase [Treponemataceae bacterium]
MSSDALDIEKALEETRTLNASLSSDLEKSLGQIAELKLELQNEQSKYQNLLREVYGKKSEKIVEEDPTQINMFDEAENDSVEIPKPAPTVIPRKKSVDGKKRGRKSLPAELEHIECLHDLSDSEKQCPCCGKDRPKIGEERSEEIEFVPAHAHVTVHVRMKYGPCKCDDFEESETKTIVTAPAPAKIVSGSAFSNQTIAFFLVAKYVDALPFYRQESIMARYGLDIGRGTMAHLAIRAASRLDRVITAMQKDIRVSPFIGMDETVVQVLKEPGRSPTSESRMWVARGFREEKPIIFFTYNKSRGGVVAKSILGDFTGFLQTDGFSGYQSIGQKPGMTHIGCWAHIRRKFYHVYENENKDALAFEMIELIKKLYQSETRLRKKLEDTSISKTEFMKLRKEETAPVFDAIQKWLFINAARVPPGSPLGKAISYAMGQYDRAIRYVEYYLVTPDNNAVERAIKPFVIGRKNWMFYDSKDGAWAGATLYSILETAKANGHEPYKYLCYLFEKLPLAKNDEDLTLLLPYILSPENY